jgi:hypothetical protein
MFTTSPRVQSTTPGERVYQACDEQLQACAAQQSALAAQISSAPNGAGFEGEAVNSSEAQQLSEHAEQPMRDMHKLARAKKPARHLPCGQQRA